MNKEKKTATEMMVNDMQKEEYYRIKHTPKEPEWKEILDIFDERFIDISEDREVWKFKKDITVGEVRYFIKQKVQSLLSQKDKEWRDKIETVIEVNLSNNPWSEQDILLKVVKKQLLN